MEDFVAISQVGASGEERHEGNGTIVDERVAILGINNRIKIIYPNTCQQSREADYLRRLEGKEGVPILYREGQDFNIVERVYELPRGKYSKEVICIFAYKLISLIT